MKRLLIVTAACLVAACQPDASGPSITGVDAISSEMYDPATRLSPTSSYAAINAHVYGSFALDAGTTTAQVIKSGPAHFPGHGASGPGTCASGTWINPQGRATSGSPERPHPHCIAPAQPLQIVLEPITACYDEVGWLATADFGQCVYKRPLPGVYETHRRLILGESFDGGVLDVFGWSVTKIPATGEGYGYTGAAKATIVGYAIEAATGARVGVLSIALSQYISSGLDHFSVDCTVDGEATPCLNHVILADYKPLPVEQGGKGVATPAVPGFLWYAPASAPFRYEDVPSK